MPLFRVGDFAVNAFVERVRQTAAWCSTYKFTQHGLTRLDPLALRHNELRPQSFFTENQPKNIRDIIALRAQIVDTLATIRARRVEGPRGLIMAHLRAKPLDLSEIRSGERGQLLLFDPNGTAFDGAAPLASEGYFDDFNEPPWD